MKHILNGLFLTAAASLLLACGGGGPIDDFVKLDTEKAAAFAAGGDDCEAKAKSVAEWRNANNQKYKAMQESLKEAYPEGPPADVMAKYGEQMAANKKAVIGAIMKCTDNEAFGKAIDETGK